MSVTGINQKPLFSERLLVNRLESAGICWILSNARVTGKLPAPY